MKTIVQSGTADYEQLKQDGWAPVAIWHGEGGAHVEMFKPDPPKADQGAAVSRRRPALTPVFDWNDFGTVMHVYHAAPARSRRDYGAGTIPAREPAQLRVYESGFQVVTNPFGNSGGIRYHYFRDLTKAQAYIIAWYKRTFTYAGRTE